MERFKTTLFFCWANHSWYRSWDGSKTLLIEQTYGDQNDWNNHFKYLLPFFLDPRYEKKDNKPLFMLFNSNIKEKSKMFNFFDQKCKEHGFNGICFIESHMGLEWETCYSIKENGKNADYIFLREPGFGIDLYRQKIRYSFIRLIKKIQKDYLNKVIKYNGNNIYDLMIKYETNQQNIIRGAFFEWDNTPRHSNRGYIITPPDKDVFFEYLNTRKFDEYIFFNAWNEWAEGMIMEPTKKLGYKYLEWIREWSELHEL